MTPRLTALGSFRHGPSIGWTLVATKMAYEHGTMIKRIVSKDGLRRIEVVARDDGFFQTYEDKWLEPEESWAMHSISGLFESAEAAELAAMTGFKL